MYPLSVQCWYWVQCFVTCLLLLLPPPLLLPPSLTKELPSCGLCPRTRFPDWCFCGFPQTLLANALIISEIRSRPLLSTVLPTKCHRTHHQHHHMSESPLSTRHGTYFNHGRLTHSAGVEGNYEWCNSAIVDRRKGWPPEHKTLILWNVTKYLGHGCFFVL